MKAVLLDGFGGVEVLRTGETEIPPVSEGQVLIKVRATSVNRGDTVQREGNYPQTLSIIIFRACLILLIRFPRLMR